VQHILFCCSKKIGFARDLVKKLKEKILRKPPIDCPTRWSSSYKMLAYLVEDAVYHFCSTYAVANSDLYLDQKVWDSICEIVSLLEPAEVAHNAEAETRRTGDPTSR